jgi:hypothetical protein
MNRHQVALSDATASRNGLETITTADLHALAWLRDGMLHFIRNCEPGNLDELELLIPGQYSAIVTAFENGDSNLDEAIKDFLATFAPFRQQPVYILMGFHGAILFEGDHSGYFEFDSPQMARDKIMRILELARATGVPLNLEFEVSSLEVLGARYPEIHTTIRQCMDAGITEIINTTYSHPYTLLIGDESNIRQFEYGGELHVELYQRKPEVYACSEFAYHPQIPQILEYFAIPFSGLRSRLAGCGPSAPYPVVLWEGLNGSRVRALCHQHNHFVGEYYASIFYREIFSQLLLARSGSNREYAVLTPLVDHTVEMEDVVEEALRVSRFADVIGSHKTYSDFFKEGPNPSGIYYFPFDQFHHWFLVPHQVDIHGRNGRLINLTCRQLERVLLQTEALVALLNMGGVLLPEEADQLHEVWKKLLLNQNHDTFGVPEYRKGQYHRERGFLNPKEFGPYVDAIVDDGVTVGERSLGILREGLIETQKLLVTALARAGYQWNDHAEAQLGLNVHAQSVEAIPSGISYPAPASPVASTQWQVELIDGALELRRADHSPLRLTLLDPTQQSLMLTTIAPGHYRSADGAAITAQSGADKLQLVLQTPTPTYRLRITGITPGSDYWRNFPLGAEPSRCALFAVSDWVWLPGNFVLYSPANHFYEADLEHTQLTNHLHAPGEYQLIFTSDPGGQPVAWVERQAAQERLPVLRCPVAPMPNAIASLPGISIDNPQVMLMALIPSGEQIRLRLMNYGASAARATVRLPAGWHLVAQVDGQGRPRGAQPQADAVELEPWCFGTFMLAQA